MAAFAFVCRAAALCAVLAWAPAAHAAEDAHAGAVKPVCLNAAETREEIRARHLIEPFAALKYAAAQHKAEALSARLCRSGDELIYEITLLNRDGRLVHVEIEAASGKPVTHAPHEPHEPHEPQVKN